MRGFRTITDSVVGAGFSRRVPQSGRLPAADAARDRLKPAPTAPDQWTVTDPHQTDVKTDQAGESTVKEQAPFDVAIIGAGPGGYVAAIRAGQLGLRTAVIERDSRLGGTCLLRGCIPTKALLRDAHLLQEIRKAARQGLFKMGDVEVSFDKIQERKNDIVAKNASGVEFLFRKNKVTTIRGVAKIATPTKIEISGDGATTEVNAKNIIIATGSEAKSLPGYDVDEKRIITNVGALDLTQIPKSMVIVGCGAVGVEFASIYSSFGCKVTLLEILPNIVPLEDEEISKELKRVFTKKGIEVYTKAKLESTKIGRASCRERVEDAEVDG